MNLFKMEIRSNLKSLIAWSVGVFLMVVSGMAKFSAWQTSGQPMQQLMNQMPKPIRSILGFGSFDLSKASGYYGMLFFYLVMMAAIHAAMLGANIISKEESDRTSEFLFVKPISRTKIITSKLLAALFNIVVFNLVTLVFSMAVIKSYTRGESVNQIILILMIGMFFLQLIFLFFGSAMAAVSKKPRTATSLATSFVLFSFMLSVAIDMNDKISILKYLTPFKYFDAKNLMLNNSLDPFFVGLSTGIIAVLIISTYFFYQKRDLNT